MKISGNETKPIIYNSTYNKYLVNIHCVLVIIKEGQKVVKQENCIRRLIQKWFLEYSPVFFPRLRNWDVPWLVWLSESSTGLRTKGSQVQFPLRAQVWVAGQILSRRRTTGNHTLIFLSLSFSSPSPLSKNKLIKYLKKKKLGCIF